MLVPPLVRPAAVCAAGCISGGSPTSSDCLAAAAGETCVGISIADGECIEEWRGSIRVSAANHASCSRESL
jgi:hypothetical protein